ncbi:MAG: hypothetical protein ACREO5_14175, partial [Candidatus Binatia bacterium]
MGTNSDLNYELFLLNTTTNQFTQITNTIGDQGFLRSSIDAAGTQVAFDGRYNPRGTNADGYPEIFLYDVSGNATTQITNSGYESEWPNISSDGRHITFGSRGDLAGGTNSDASVEIFVYDVAANVITQVTRTDFPPTDTISDRFSRISSDGSRLAFISVQDLTGNNGDNNEEVFVASLGAPPPTPTPTPFPTPVGSSKIIFTTNRSGSSNYQIFTMDPDGSSQAALPIPSVTAEFEPAISHDGSKIAFSDGDDIYEMNSDGSGRVDLTNTPGVPEAHPRFSPDGSKITYISQQSDGTWDVYLMNANGTSQVNLTNNAENDTDPTFSPDGSKIAFTARRN